LNLFQLGDFTLSSGRKSDVKIDCDALSDESIQALAWMMKRMLLPFGTVEGIPQGGLRLAAELAKHSLPTSKRHLIVDDVLTTGASMEKARDKYLHQPDRIVLGVVIFARGPRVPLWIKPLFQSYYPL